MRMMGYDDDADDDGSDADEDVRGWWSMAYIL
jgi:hypothetical protein